MTHDQYANELQTALDDIGADVDIDDQDVDVGLEMQTDDAGVEEFIEATIIDPVSKDSGRPLGDITKEVMLDGTHAAITVQRRPQCPTCEYVPVGEESFPDLLTGICVECGSDTCPDCVSHCFSCNRKLCNKCSDGYGLEGEVLCQKHRQDIEREKKFQFSMQVWGKNLEEEDIFLEHETEREIAFKELELDAEIQREQMELEAEIERRQQQLAEFEAKSEHMDRVKQRELEEQQFELDKVQTMLEERRKATRLALDEEIERRQQDLEEFKAVAEQKINQAEQALKEREQQFEETKFDREHEFERHQFEKEHQLDRDKHDFEREKFDKEHQLDRDKHETEREDKRAKRDLDQQKVDLKRKKAEVEEWVKKRGQKLKEYKAVTQGKKRGTDKRANPRKGLDGTSKGPSWQEMMEVTEGINRMSNPTKVKMN
jgi:DNA repair exonuclease SbcCD ATPase subunit